MTITELEAKGITIPENSNSIEIHQLMNYQQPQFLAKKVVQSGLWVFALRVASRALGFIRTIILARILVPEDFGLLGIAILAISALDTFSQTGFHAALIQRKENLESYLDTAWTVSVIRGFFLFLVLLLIAPLIANFFNTPHAVLVIRLIAITALFSGCTNIGIVFLQKELEFRKKFIYEFSATVINLSVAISLAFVMRNVWALVWGILSAGFVRLFMSYIIHPYRPRVEFDRKKFMHLFGFGRWILGASVLVFLITSGDDLFIAKALGVTALGLYQLAFLISNLPTTEITHVISQVTFPAYSKLQFNLPKLNGAYLKVLKITTFVSTPIAAGIFTLSSEFTQIFLGTKWMSIVPLMKILIISGLVRSIQATTGPVFLAVNRPDIEPKWQMVRLLVLALTIYPLFCWIGLVGISISVLLSNIAVTIGFSLMVLQITKCGLKDFFKPIIIPVLNVLIMAFLIALVKDYIPLVGVLHFFFCLAVGITIYFFNSYIFDKIFRYEIKNLIKEILRLI